MCVCVCARLIEIGCLFYSFSFIRSARCVICMDSHILCVLYLAMGSAVFGAEFLISCRLTHIHTDRIQNECKKIKIITFVTA